MLLKRCAICARILHRRTGIQLVAVYVDSEYIVWRGKTWCHLVADSTDELHAFARRLGLRASWFQSKNRYPHYDVTQFLQQRALAMGAILADRRTIVECGRKMRAEMAEQCEREHPALVLFSS
ncbi:DUF4031 domain-containing protein [Frateuria sp. GZRe12]|uniref:DUF4031 domain-containing protein n=1 Tax=Frateuria sp. GZRe12 TaxID=3351533 RepID=UPI003EDB906A